MITYERGVEDITWACGTGAIAGACAYLIQHALEGPQQVSMKSKGGNLDISLRYVPNKGIFDIFMTGPARAVFQGKIDVPT
jgi:diaminopimelate epimerase